MKLMWPWLNPSPGDVMGALLLLLFLSLFAIVAASGPFGPRNFGFGPEWDCVNNGRGEPICIKRSPARRELN
jgi:hypothetical protein